MRRLAPPVHAFIQNALTGKPGGISLQGFVGVRRHPTSRRLLFTVAIEVGFYSTENPCLAGRTLRWTDVSDKPEEFGHRVMEQTSMIETFTGVRHRSQEIRDFLSPLAGHLFDAYHRLMERAERNRQRAANRAVIEWTRGRKGLRLVGADHTFAPVDEEPAVVVGM